MVVAAQQGRPKRRLGGLRTWAWGPRSTESGASIRYRCAISSRMSGPQSVPVPLDL